MRSALARSVMPLALTAATALSCSKKPAPTGAPASTSSAPASASSAAVPRVPLPRSTSGSLARDVAGKALYVADEDAGVVRRLGLPLVAGAVGAELKLPGRPAQLLPRERELLVTVRHPSQLLVLSDGPEGLQQQGSLALPADAWSMALSPDERTLVVVSAWSHTVSVVDVATRAIVASLDVAREPRGVVVTPDGRRAYVTHLMGTALTRVDLAGAGSTATVVPLAADPARAPRRAPASASLAYAPVISVDGSRLFVPRHALGTISPDPGKAAWGAESFAWWGTSTVDVMLLRDESALMPDRASVALVGRFGGAVGMPEKPTPPEAGTLPVAPPSTFVQPRDALLRRRTRTLLVASEGEDRVTEHDLDALNPGLGLATAYQLGDGYLTGKSKAPSAETGSAPQGLALSVDETELYVWARGSREVFAVPLHADPLKQAVVRAAAPDGPKIVAGPFPEPMSTDAAAGRKLYFLARDRVMSGGLGCAGCHPDGRDDGFVWHETRQKSAPEGSSGVFVGHPLAVFDPVDGGRPRRTPMLAGRVSSSGPYGWRAQSRDLEARLIEGFALHRWSPPREAPTAYERANRLRQLAAYLRTGLHPPARDTGPLSPVEERGKAIFESEKAQCSSCHPGDSEFTTRVAIPLRSPLPRRDGFGAEEDDKFRVPSLFFVGGIGPYYHDGSVKTLTELVEKNGNRMGDTSGLSAADRAALVAYLRRL